MTVPKRLVVHFQGYRGVCRTPTGGSDVSASPIQTLALFDLINQFEQALQDSEQPDTLLVFAPSRGKNDDYRSHLVGQLTQLSNWIQQTLRETSTIPWILTGHSGAGSIISQSLYNSTSAMRAQVDSVLLFDATYSMSTHINRWKALAQANRALFIQSIAKLGSSPDSGAQFLASELNQLRFGRDPLLYRPVQTATTRESHCRIPNAFFRSMLAKALQPFP